MIIRIKLIKILNKTYFKVKNSIIGLIQIINFKIVLLKFRKLSILHRYLIGLKFVKLII